MDDDLLEAVQAELKKRQDRQDASDFKKWCEWLDNTPADAKLILKSDLIADLELQPHRWLSAGADLLKSQHITGFVQLMNGQKGEPLSSFLPYPVFQMGAEIFLKGMWLCQFEECRGVAHSDYVDPANRLKHGKLLKGLGHDLIKIIAQLRLVQTYQDNPGSIQFLNRVEAVIRQHYFPLYVADARSSEWANSRYPKRFYSDSTKMGHADAFQSYPQQQFVIGLFAPMERHLDRLWSLRAGLLSRRKKTKSTNTEKGSASKP